MTAIPVTTKHFGYALPYPAQRQIPKDENQRRVELYRRISLAAAVLRPFSGVSVQPIILD
jgi:hypothetical protein